MTIELPIACSLEEQEMRGRVAAWEALLTDALIEREATGRGVRLVLRSSPETAQRLGQLIELESKCCAWMTFEIGNGDALTVDITAADDLGRAAIRDLFSEQH